jgi:hypothetical protein
VGSDRPCWFLAYFFAIFLAFKKGEGVSAVLLAIFLRKKGSDSPFFIILFTESHCTDQRMTLISSEKRFQLTFQFDQSEFLEQSSPFFPFCTVTARGGG